MSLTEMLLRWFVRPSSSAPARSGAGPRRRPARPLAGWTAPASLLGAVASWLVRPPDVAAHSHGAGERAATAHSHGAGERAATAHAAGPRPLAVPAAPGRRVTAPCSRAGAAHAAPAQTAAVGAGARFAPPLAAPPSVAWRGDDGAALAVLAEAATAHALGACAGLGAAGRGVALVCVWRARVPGSGGAPPVPAARRLAGALRARGLTARAVGRLVVVELADDSVAACGEFARTEAVGRPAARVLALGGARGEEWDEALVERDAVLVHGCDARVVELAVERLVERGVPAAAFAPPPSRVVRRLATMGLVLPGSTPAAALRCER